mgnify:CR=1 FL=1
MIHSRKKEPDEVFEFCDRFRMADGKTPLVAVPTSYHSVTEDELQSHGVNIVIYANQLTRSALSPPAGRKDIMDAIAYYTEAADNSNKKTDCRFSSKKVNQKYATCSLWN